MLAAGTKFKSYQILAFVGAGGSGAVYKALQEDLDREVALKLVELTGRTAAEERVRFLREARALARLSHPSVVRIYDFGEDGNRLYYSMEFAPGSSLDKRLGEGKGLPFDEAASIVLQVLEALEAVHGADVMHRDIKPANVLIRPNGTVLLSDFGLARESHATRMTRAGSLLGTLPYLPPEIAGATELDPRADLYQVGILLYELVHGTIPYSGTDVMAMLTGKPLDHKAPIEALQASPQLQQFLLRAMEPERERRFQSAAEMREALEAVRLASKRAASSGIRRSSSRTRLASSSKQRIPIATPPAPSKNWMVPASVCLVLAAGASWLAWPRPVETVPAARPQPPPKSAPAPAVGLPARRLEVAESLRANLLAEKELPLTRVTDGVLEVAIAAAGEINQAQLHWSRNDNRPSLARVNGRPASASLASMLIDGNNRLEFASRRLPDALLRISRRPGASLALPPASGPAGERLTEPGTPLGDLFAIAKTYGEGNRGDALEATKKAVEMAPFNWEAHWRRGFGLHLANYVSRGLTNAGGALELLAVTEGDPEASRTEAFRHLNRALELNPRGDNIWLDFGICYRNDLRLADARRMMQMACVVNPKISRYWLNLLVAMAQGVPKGQEARHPLAPLVLAIAKVAIAPEKENMVRWYVERGALYRQFGLTEEARKDFEWVLEREPGNARAKAGLQAK